jgi:hypothetical protein
MYPASEDAGRVQWLVNDSHQKRQSKAGSGPPPSQRSVESVDAVGCSPLPLIVTQYFLVDCVRHRESYVPAYRKYSHPFSSCVHCSLVHLQVLWREDQG